MRKGICIVGILALLLTLCSCASVQPAAGNSETTQDSITSITEVNNVVPESSESDDLPQTVDMDVVSPTAEDVTNNSLDNDLVSADQAVQSQSEPDKDSAYDEAFCSSRLMKATQYINGSLENTTSYTYDDAGRLVSYVSEPDIYDDACKFIYEDDHLTQFAWIPEIGTDYTYNENGKLVSAYERSEGEFEANYTVISDEDGRVSEVIQVSNYQPDSPETYKYSYDGEDMTITSDYVTYDVHCQYGYLYPLVFVISSGTQSDVSVFLTQESDTVVLCDRWLVNSIAVPTITSSGAQDYVLNDKAQPIKEDHGNWWIEYTYEDDSSSENTEINLEKNDVSVFETTPVRFMFMSPNGAGTTIEIMDDWSFVGQSSDWMGGITNICSFTGQFSAPDKVDDYTYSMHLLSLEYDAPGYEYEVDGMPYVTAEPFNIQKTDDEFLIYLPGSSLADMDDVFSYLLRNLTPVGAADKMPEGCYGLYDIDYPGGGSGFISIE